jgi:type IV pilus assembly protein PilM
VGLDLGSHSIKLVELEQAGAGVRLVTQLIQELPAASPARPTDAAGPSNEPAPRPVDRSGWLQIALREVEACEVHLAVSGPEVAIHRVLVPPMSAKELREAVKWQVKDQLPFSLQEAVLDFRVIGEVWEKDLKKLEVLVAAASRAFLQERLALVEGSGVRVASVVPSPYALWAGLTLLAPETRQGTVALIEFGARTTHVAIVKDGHLRVVRELSIGSASLAEALTGVVASEQGDIAIDASTAEALMRRYGVLVEQPDGRTDEGVPFVHLAALIRPVLEHLLTEVSRFLDFYKIQMDAAGVSQVLVCGGGAMLKQLEAFLAGGLGVAVSVFNPLSRIADQAPSVEAGPVVPDGPRLAVAIGAALDHGQGLNVLPGEVRQATEAMRRRRTLIRVAQGLATAALAGTVALYGSEWRLSRRLQAQQAMWATWESASLQYKNLTLERRGLEDAIARLEVLIEQQPVWEGLLKEVAELTPAAITLETLAVTPVDDSAATGDQQLAMTGWVVAGGTEAHRSLSEFVDALERSVFVTGVELGRSELSAGPTAATRFELKGLLE